MCVPTVSYSDPFKTLKANCPQNQRSLSMMAVIKKSMNKLFFIQMTHSVTNLQPIIYAGLCYLVIKS